MKNSCTDSLTHTIFECKYQILFALNLEGKKYMKH